MALQFGTDGLRGIAYSELTVELATQLGRAAARHLPAKSFVVGGDTRESSPALRSAFSAGVVTEGVDVIDVGVLTTPGVAFLAASRQIPGAIVSASHNPYQDNGIKLVSATGTKIGDKVERAIEAELERFEAETEEPTSVTSIGKIETSSDLIEEYLDHLVSTVSIGKTNLRVVCDCANGASSAIVPLVFARLGIETVVVCNEPNGTNINDHCGSTHPERIIATVLETGADLGLSFDGDADRLIAVTNDGTVVDGDHLIALFAHDLAARGELAGNGVVITVMSNLGLRLSLQAQKMVVIETPVGDRYVADALSENRYSLGGEQSGHIIFSRDATTGDGVLTGLKLIELMTSQKKPLSEMSAVAMTRLPQELRTIYVTEPNRLDDAHIIWDEVASAEHSLGERGRVLLRRSGTESAVRVMVEAPTQDLAHEIVERLASLVSTELRPDN